MGGKALWFPRMCRLEKSMGSEYAGERQVGLKAGGGEVKVEKLRGSMVSRSRMKLWMIRVTTTVLLWTCVVQLMALGEMWGPRVLKGWPSCFTPSYSAVPLKPSSVVEKIALPPKSEFVVLQKIPLFFSILFFFLKKHIELIRYSLVGICLQF